MDSQEDKNPLSSQRPSRKTQSLVALAGTIGNFAVGCILGYSSPASPQLKIPAFNSSESVEDCGGDLSLSFDDSDISLFSSTMNVGALIGAPIAGVLIKNYGRKLTMLGVLIPFVLGWTLIGFASNLAMIVSGRIVTGICCGFVSLTIPTYIGEIASPDIRGLLASGFQLMATLGILYIYILGAVVCWQWLALASLIPVVIFGASMFFCPESPAYLVTKEKEEEARKALVTLRGKYYNIEPELDRMKVAAAEQRENKGSIRDLAKPYVMKPFIISMAVMFFQQTSGVNALLFNLDSIFKSAGTEMSTSVSSIIVAAVQAVSTAVASLLMDRAGRKVLLMFSSGAMSISLVAMGVYFHLVEKEDPAVDSLGWLPLVSLMVFFIFFSIGYGPIPWVMMGELFTMDVKEITSSIATLFNWTMSFLVTLLFNPMKNGMGDDGVYWFYAGICAINFLFCVFVVKETKGKTIEEITAMFGGPTSTSNAKSDFSQTNDAFESNEKPTKY